MAKTDIEKDVQILQMDVWFRTPEANASVYRQTGLRGADRHEMVSTCYIAGPPFFCTLQLHDTQTCIFSQVCLLTRLLPLVLPCAHRSRERDACPLLSLPLLPSSSILLLSHRQTNPSLLCLSIYFILALSLAAVWLSPPLLSSLQFAYVLSSSYLSFSGCLSASASLVLSSLHREKSSAPSILFPSYGRTIFLSFWA